MQVEEGYTHKSFVDLVVEFLNVLIHTKKECTHNISVDLVVDVLTGVMHVRGAYILNACSKVIYT